MAKLYFKYGAMGSSKSAQALITKYNYEENDLRVWLIKPSADARDGVTRLRSRIGLEADAESLAPEVDVYARFVETEQSKCDIIIADECQFFTPTQIDQLRAIVDECNVPVICFGLRTDFQCRLFPGSRRLMEVADTILEIKTICDCGAKGDRQCPDRFRRSHCHGGCAGAARRQRQLHRHVPQVLCPRHPGAPPHPPARQRGAGQPVAPRRRCPQGDQTARMGEVSVPANKDLAGMAE